MGSSRIYIRGLPPSLSSEDFKAHFSKQSTITDAKFIPHRRIGYVGYKSPDDAANAVKFHDKTFMRMTRIRVELARSVDDQQALRPSAANGIKRKNEYDDGSIYEEKRQKQASPPEKGDKSKLQEYLAVMQPPSKSKIWENQDSMVTDKSPKPTPIISEEIPTENLADTEYEVVPKMPKRQSKSDHGDRQAEQVPEKNSAITIDQRSDDHLMPAITPSTQQESSYAEMPGKSDTVSDTDWLRSRTSRLLGLVDDEDAVDLFNGADEHEHEKTRPTERHSQTENGNTSDASSQTNQDVHETFVGKKEDSSVKLENDNSSNGRLFIRNLTYTTTNDDLRMHFQAGNYGTIEEVEFYLIYQFVSVRICFGDEYPDRDSLCFACDVTRKSILVDISYF